MKLLLDHNLPPYLIGTLADICPGSAHVRSVGLDRADDEPVWLYAQEHGYAIISKDTDFYQLSVLRGHPPKVIWLRCGNCSTKEIEHILKKHLGAIKHFERDNEISFLMLGIDH